MNAQTFLKSSTLVQEDTHRVALVTARSENRFVNRFRFAHIFASNSENRAFTICRQYRQTRK